MRSGHIPGKTLGIIAVLVLLLQGCGHKGPLMLPAPKTQATKPQLPDSQQPVFPSSQQSK
jgi:predicted small lipoprotein YifL